jgi:hypothetical protein
MIRQLCRTQSRPKGKRGRNGKKNRWFPSQPIDKFIKAPLENNPMPSIGLFEALREKGESNEL